MGGFYVHLLLRFTVLIGVAALFSAVPAAGQHDAPKGEQIPAAVLSGYDFENWPGRDGDVIPGFDPASPPFARYDLQFDHDEWLVTDGEWVVIRQFVTPGRELTVDVAVARSCRSAHRALFEHLTRQTAAATLAPPLLPNGQVRLTDIGDVCFGVPQNGPSPFRSVEFVRNNIVVLLTVDEGARIPLLSVAGEIDRHLLSLPAFPDTRSSGRWISIDDFRIGEGPGSARPVRGALLPVEISVTVPSGGDHSRSWRLSEGGIVEREGELFYLAEASGNQTITLLIRDRSGLAAHADVRLTVGE